jgi:zinc-finger-containing domain
MSNKNLKKWKHVAHEAFDKLWNNSYLQFAYAHNPKAARVAAYRWLAYHLKLTPEECHISQFNITQCQQVVDLCINADLKTIFPRAYFKTKPDSYLKKIRAYKNQ